jgi:hypothetical protein
MSLLPVLALAGLLGLGGCATPPGGTSAAHHSGAAEQAATIEVEPWDGDGMDIPLDGSSMANFEAYMARVKKYSSEPDYITLKNAIDYLQFYDITVKRDKEKLIAKLDGLTGHEIVAKVGWRKPEGKVNKPKEATPNPKLMDT